MKKIFGRPAGLTDTLLRYCPGCGHGIVHRIIGELLVKLDIREKTIGIAPVGCSWERSSSRYRDKTVAA